MPRPTSTGALDAKEKHRHASWDGSALISGNIFDNGNVGIGTINPGKILTLQGDYSFGEIRLQQNYWDTLLY